LWGGVREIWHSATAIGRRDTRGKKQRGITPARIQKPQSWTSEKRFTESWSRPTRRPSQTKTSGRKGRDMLVISSRNGIGSVLTKEVPLLRTINKDQGKDGGKKNVDECRL